MRTEEMEQVNQQEVARLVHNYRLQKYLSIAGIVVVTLHLLAFLFTMDGVLWIPGYRKFMLKICLIIIHFVAIGVLAFVLRGAKAWITGALTKSCDPFLYEACLYRLGVGDMKRQVEFLTARYYEGNFAQAKDTLQHIIPDGLKGGWKLNYYLLKCALCFRDGEEEKARELEGEFQRRITGKEDAKNMQYLCNQNNLWRAWENKDYASAYQFLMERELFEAGVRQPWGKVGVAYWLGKLDEACGNQEGKKARYDYVLKNGNRLFYTAELRKKEQETDVENKE